MKKIIYLSFIFLMCTGYTCTKNTDKCHKTITFINNFSTDVYIHPCFTYPDTLGLYKEFANPLLQAYMYKVKAGEKNIGGLSSRSCFDDRVERGEIMVYVYGAEILETIPWDTIGKYHMVLKTIRPILEEMERSNWTITFTGEEK